MLLQRLAHTVDNVKTTFLGLLHLGINHILAFVKVNSPLAVTYKNMLYPIITQRVCSNLTCEGAFWAR